MLLSVLFLATSASADFTQTAQFGAANCAGAPSTLSAQNLGCSSIGSGLYRAISCANASFGFMNVYSTSDCTGAASASTVMNGLTWGCSTSGASSTQLSCVSGAWSAPRNSLAVINYPSSPSCPQTTPADNAVSYTTDTCLSFGSASARATCNSSTYTLTTFSSSDCSGASTPSSGDIGCAASGGQGVSVYQCSTSGAPSSTIALAAIALMLVAATTTSAL